MTKMPTGKSLIIQLVTVKIQLTSYFDQFRMEEAREAYGKALATFETFVAKNPDMYSKDVERIKRLLDGIQIGQVSPN